MNDDRDNSNIQSNPKVSSVEANTSSEEKDILAPKQLIEPDKEVNSFPEEKNTSASEQSTESDKEDPVNRDSNVKAWLLLLIILITLGTGFYFYTYKKDSSLFINLPGSLVKFFSTAPQLNNLSDIQSKETLARSPEDVIKKTQEATPPDTQSKEIPAKPSREVIEKIEETISLDAQLKEIPAKFSGEIAGQTKKTTIFDKTTNENEKTIDLLRNEIQSLKAELKKRSSTSQNFQIKRPHISGGFIEEKPEETSQQEKKEPKPTMTTLPAIPSLSIGEPLNQQSHPQKKSLQIRSEEVQAYLDFVENTGEKLIKLIEKGWTRLQALVMEYKKNN